MFKIINISDFEKNINLPLVKTSIFSIRSKVACLAKPGHMDILKQF